MDAAALRAIQAPIQVCYKVDPKDAYITLKACGRLDNQSIACKVETGRLLAVAGSIPQRTELALNCAPVTCCTESE
jgi:hypothetical protein